MELHSTLHRIILVLYEFAILHECDIAQESSNNEGLRFLLDDVAQLLFRFLVEIVTNKQSLCKTFFPSLHFSKIPVSYNVVSHNATCTLHHQKAPARLVKMYCAVLTSMLFVVVLYFD